MHKISIVNQKGGVGKTTTAVNLAAALSRMGKSVLLIDFDPQGSATEHLGYTSILDDTSGRYYSVVKFLHDEPFQPLPVSERFDLLAGSEELAFVEQDLLKDVLSGATRLTEALKRINVPYDYVITDCPPNLGMLSTTAMIACPKLIVPVKLEPLSIRRARRLAEHLKALSGKFPEIGVLGFLGTFYRTNSPIFEDARNDLARLFPDQLFKISINEAVAFPRSSGEGKPLLDFAADHRGSAQYTQLAEEVIARG
jgi:chromosome partitioning protein